MTFRRALTIASLAAIVVIGVESRLLLLPFIDRGPSERAMARGSDRAWPDYPLFLQGVREHTQPGDTIAIIVPAMRWEAGYSYAYYRASYFLAGREVLPLVTPKDAVVMDNFRRARYAAFWHVKPPANARVVWQGNGGLLVTR